MALSAGVILKSCNTEIIAQLCYVMCHESLDMRSIYCVIELYDSQISFRVNQLIFIGQISKNKTGTVEPNLLISYPPKMGTWKLVKSYFAVYEKNKSEVKAILQRFEGADVLVIHAKVSSNARFSLSASQNQSTTLLS